MQPRLRRGGGRASQQADDLSAILLEEFAELPKKKGTDEDWYSVINVSPSVVPNPFVPSFREFTYNTTGSEVGGLKKKKGKKGKKRPPKKGKRVDCGKKENKGRWECRKRQGGHQDAEAPARRNGMWTPLGYAQYWLPGLAGANKSAPPRYKLEYLTFELPGRNGGDPRWGLPKRALPRSLLAGNKTGRYLPYRMADLTVSSWLALARRLGDAGRAKLRARFSRYMYLGGSE